ncbi:hypothetical protein Bca52824_060671 [Brassica carinata]|uniref:Toc75-like POTRA domain-containing protein n=1 Tax=Brassica carinata TaxID=52824 RepID=A0A8X7UHT8_BRACI|nr:hypothetical protein Bca52824_060671 [Brassica carinata]
MIAETEMTVVFGENSPEPAVADEEQSPDWDSHGLPANIWVQEVQGGVYTKAQLQKELETLATCGMFEKVDLEGETKPDGTHPRSHHLLRGEHSKPIETDADMTDKEKLEYCSVRGCCRRLGTVFRNGTRIKGKQRYLSQLSGLFSNIEVNPRQDEKKNEGGIIVEIKLKWSLVPGPGGPPTLASFQPGGVCYFFEHRNIQGLNRSLMGSVTTSNFLNPQDDLSFKL